MRTGFPRSLFTRILLSVTSIVLAGILLVSSISIYLLPPGSEWQVIPAYIVATLVILLAVTAVAFLFARHMTAPIQELARATRAVAQGDLQAPLLVQRGDEIGQLADDFRAMQRELAASREALLDEKARYAELSDLKEQMLANMPHELKTPLAAIAASLELLENDRGSLTTDERARLLTSLRRSVLRLQYLIDNMLDAASIQAGQFRVRPQPVPFLPVLEEARLFLQPLLDQKGQRLVVADRANGILLHADPERIVQVLINLLSNAIKYGETGRPIEVQTVREGDALRVCVRNSGGQVPPEVQRSLFERFARSPLTVHVDGSGLGLAIARTIVNLHHGQIEIDSSAGETTVSFTLPIFTEDSDEDPDRG